jgi:hypothetical protein
VFWNNRTVTSAGQAFTDAIKCNRADDGTDLVINWGAFVAPSGIGAYDFSYDNASSTMAICDFANRVVHVFQVTVYRKFGTGCPGQGGISPTIAGTGSAFGNGTLTFTVSNAAPLSLGLFAFGDSDTSLPLPFGSFCPLHVTPVLLVDGLFVTAPGAPGTGTGAVSLPLVPGLAGISLTVQGLILENGDINQLVTSNGTQIILQ